MAFKSASESQITMSLLMTPEHSNFGGKVHGGYVLMLMDQIAFACASKHSGNYCVTASVNKVDFLNPINVGELVHLRASVNYTGRTSMVIGLRVESEKIQTGEIKHCNSSYFTMVAKDDDGKSVPIPGLIINSESGVRRFSRSIQRKDQVLARAERFDENEFQAEEYISLIEGENLQLKLKR
ncbi:acyl-CoA thioesterase [Crocinitomicaceae bacterium]|nr:acyl-CoA thioesterase [Crocinitomicaceae bacterium]